MRKVIVICIALLSSFSGVAQWNIDKETIHDVEYIPNGNDTMTVFKYRVNGNVHSAAILEGDTILWGVLNEILLIDKPHFDNDEARIQYYRLKRKVLNVYPWAVLAANRLDSLNLRLDTITDEDERDDYIEEYNDFLKDRFEPELRKLTRSEGQILTKLIYRETGMSVYDLISTYRSGWNAFWWNVNANWYDISLKKPYEPEENDEDRMIEMILLRAFSQNLLQERVPFYPPTE